MKERKKKAHLCEKSPPTRYDMWMTPPCHFTSKPIMALWSLLHLFSSVYVQSLQDFHCITVCITCFPLCILVVWIIHGCIDFIICFVVSDQYSDHHREGTDSYCEHHKGCVCTTNKTSSDTKITSSYIAITLDELCTSKLIFLEWWKNVWWSQILKPNLGNSVLYRSDLQIGVYYCVVGTDH